MKSDQEVGAELGQRRPCFQPGNPEVPHAGVEGNAVGYSLLGERLSDLRGQQQDGNARCLFENN